LQLPGYGKSEKTMIIITKKNSIKKSRIRLLVAITTVVVAIVFGSLCYAQNPIIQTKYTADPAPMVYHDTVFLYTSHDEDDAFGFKMLNWMLYTSTDMVNWTDRGIVAGVKEPYRTFTWAMAIVPGPHSVFPEKENFIYIVLQSTKGRWQLE